MRHVQLCSAIAWAQSWLIQNTIFKPAHNLSNKMTCLFSSDRDDQCMSSFKILNNCIVVDPSFPATKPGMVHNHTISYQNNILTTLQYNKSEWGPGLSTSIMTKKDCVYESIIQPKYNSLAILSSTRDFLGAWYEFMREFGNKSFF